MSNASPETLAATVAAIQQNKQYAAIDADLVERIAREELAKRNNKKEVVKHARSRLRQAGTAYFKRQINYRRALQQLQDAATLGEQKAVCRDLMAMHASTAERLPILEDLFALLADEIPQANSVLDIACGLNPLTIPWQSLAPNASYNAIDIFADMMAFLNDAIPILGVTANVQTASVIPTVPSISVDVAYIFKAISCLEQLESNAGQLLLEGVNAKHIVATFPLQSLGGRKKGMLTTYQTRMQTLTQDQPWAVKEFIFDTELVYIIEK